MLWDGRHSLAGLTPSCSNARCWHTAGIPKQGSGGGNWGIPGNPGAAGLEAVGCPEDCAGLGLGWFEVYLQRKRKGIKGLCCHWGLIPVMGLFSQWEFCRDGSHVGGSWCKWIPHGWILVWVGPIWMDPGVDESHCGLVPLWMDPVWAGYRSTEDSEVKRTQRIIKCSSSEWPTWGLNPSGGVRCGWIPWTWIPCGQTDTTDMTDVLLPNCSS